MADMTALPLQEFIASLEEACLPKIIQVCSGVYFQGSIYEISGNEVSFSTGDLLKVIDIKLLSVCCEDIHNREQFELPINHTGLLKVLPDEMPFSTVEEMLSMRPVGLESSLPFTFTSRCKMALDNLTIGAGKALTVLSIERHKGQEDQVRCQVESEQKATAEVCVPFSYRGEFYECEGEDRFTLQEIMSSSRLRSRKFRFVNTNKCERTLVFSPIYQVHAIMSLRKDVLKFPSSLELEVVDVTDQCKGVEFVTPLSLTDVWSQPDESFPVVVKILESPPSDSMLKCSWLSRLAKNEHLVLHKKGTLPMVLLSNLKVRKVQQFFIAFQQYGGRFRRRPREFSSVYELYVASVQTPGLVFSVTKNCEEDEEEGVPALSVGEQLEILRCDRMELPGADKRGQKTSVEALVCQRLQEPDDEDDEDDDDGGDEKEAEQEEDNIVFLPLFIQSHFVEVLRDKKKYKLRDLGGEFSLPLDVKVASRDTELETDPLVGLTCLRIEAALLEPTIQASFPSTPGYCFEIPTQWLSMMVQFTQKSLPLPQGEAPQCRMERVIEVTDVFFYELCKRVSAGPPPPRPPKPDLSSVKPPKKPTSKPSKKSSKAEKKNLKSCKSAPNQQFSELTLNNKKKPPIPPFPDNIDEQPPPIAPRKHQSEEITGRKALFNTYVKMEDSKKGADMIFSKCNSSMSSPFVDFLSAEVDSDHDYELVEDTLRDMVSGAKDEAFFY